MSSPASGDPPRAFRPPRLVMLDRDGVLNRNLRHGVRAIEDWQWLDGSMTAVRILASAGFTIKIITNQANIGRGIVTHQHVRAIHAAALGDLAIETMGIDDFLYCPHVPDEGCGCRKPRPGLVSAALASVSIDPTDGLVVGDHETDIAAAAAAGCTSLHVRTGRGLAPPPGSHAGYLGSVEDLVAAAELLVAVAGKIEHSHRSINVERERPQ